MGRIYKTRQTIKEQGRVRHNEKEGDILIIEKANTRKNKTRRSGGQTRKNGTKRDKSTKSQTKGERAEDRARKSEAKSRKNKLSRERTVQHEKN